MTLSGYQDINSVVRYSTDGFDFASTLGDFIGNAEYSYGNEDYKHDVSAIREGRRVFPNARSNIWHTLSAIGQDIGEVTYANVRNYIDIVSNVDICKTRSLISMMKNLGIDYSIVEDINDFPIEVLNLIDIFSIDKKYLLDNDKIKEDLVLDIKQHTSADAGENSVSAYYRYFSNDFQISSQYPQGKCFLTLESDVCYTGEDLKGTVRSIADIVRAGFWSDSLNAAVYRKYRTVAERSSINYDLYKIGFPEFGDGFQSKDYYVLLSSDSVVCSVDAGEFESSVVPDAAFNVFPGRPDIQIKYLPLQAEDSGAFGVKYDNIDNDKYFKYISSVFAELLSSYLELKYNVDEDISSLGVINPIYWYIEDEYLQNRDFYKKRAQLTSDIMEFKRINNIPYGFDEQKVVDNIDAGADSLDNYEGYTLDLIKMEIERRARRLTYSDMNSVSAYSASMLSTDNFQDTSKNKTRYSYYRKAKVLEYARFIDNMFALGNIGTRDSAQYSRPYRFDSNRYEISSDISSHIFMYPAGGQPYIHQDELDYVAANLATLTQYIAKLRQKVKLQVRKNYMKGTNNLLVYLINEFLVDYSRTNKLFSEYNRQCQLMDDIYENLSSSDIDDIEVVEYMDDTEYYNLSSERSVESITQSYNNDFKSSYFKNVGGKLSAFDGKTFTLDQIKEFYLSSLGLKNSLSDTTDGVIRFLNSIFEIGQHDSFVDARGNFACRLDDGRFTTELWDELDSISGTYTRYKGYLSAGDYEYPADTVQNQLTDVIENYIGNKLSDMYLEGVSDVYDQHHEEIEHMSADVIDISSRYTDLVGSDEYALYLNKSKCKYCYTDGEEDLAVYKHDWYNGNYDVYNSQYLIDKIGDLKRFISDAKNMKCYPVLDTLDYVRTEFSRISSELMSNAENPAEKYGYMDIMSPFLDEEIRSIYGYLESESNLRKSELQSMLANIRQQAQQAKDTYDKLDNTFDSVLANYDPGDGVQMGEINANFFGECEDKSSGEHERHGGKRWRKYSYTYEKFLKSDTYKKFQDDPDFEFLVGTWIQKTDPGEGKKSATKHNVVFFRKPGDPDDEVKGDCKYDQFEVNSGKDVDTCEIFSSDDLGLKIQKVQAWMSQITDGHVEPPGEDEDCCYIADPVYGYLNTGVLAAVNSIEGDLADLAKTVSSIVSQVNSIGGSFSKTTDIRTLIDELQKYLATDMDGNFSGDAKLKAYADIKRVIQTLSAQYDNLKLVYSSMPQDSEYADYIVEEYKSDFTLENVDSLSAYVVQKGISDKAGITASVKQLIDEYNMQQNLYTAIAEQIDAQVTDVGMLEPDPYLELQLEYIYKKLLADIDNRIVIAQEHIENDKNAVRITVDPLSTRISSQMSAYEHDFEYYFDRYLSTLNYFQRPEYLSAYELFKTYGGTSACYDPYYNYKNVTHPSFQVHPFLWNFVEATGMRDIVSRSFDGLLNEKLESLQIHKYIDGMIGEFGQVVNIWQNNTTDSTGYTTRYEVNTHTDEDTDYSPVVDYDGGFYPPAVQSYLQDRETAVRSVLDGATTDRIAQNVKKAIGDKQLSALDADQIYNMTYKYVEPYYAQSGYHQIVDDFVTRYTVETSAGYVIKGTKDDLRNMVQNGLSGTFYQNYYRHLHLDNDAYYRKYIAAQLSCDDIYYRIQAIAEDKDAVSDVYDIYKYGLDYQKNMYILYKKYRQPNPTYKERRNTPGALWIRLKHHPIAFPAILSGENTEYQACYCGDGSQFNSYLSGICYGMSVDSAKRHVDFIDMDRYCYDFQFSYDREVIAMPCVNRDAADPIFRTCDYPELVMSIIGNKASPVSTRRKLLCFTNNDGEADDVVSMPEWVPSVAGILQDEIQRCPAYLGAYSPSLKNIRLVYAYKNHAKYTDDVLSVCLSRGRANSDVSLMIAKYNEYTNGIGANGNACIEGNLTGVSPNFSVASHEIAFTCEDLAREKLAFAFPVQRGVTNFTTYNNVQISVDPNAEGGCIDDPSSEEMTSHDIFDEHVAIVHAHFNGSLFQDGAPALYNLNADMSYQPVYPGYEHKYESQQLSAYENIELLGKSKDISKSIASVNPNADPYFQLSDMLENGVYGRVYEDYTKSVEQEILNKTFIIRTNPAFGENKAEDWRLPSRGYDKNYTWHIDLPSCLVSSDLTRMNCVIFNTGNMGKNPYFIGKVSQLLDYTPETEKWLPVYYNSADSEKECVISSLDVTGKYTITGINRQGYTNASDNNRIYNIDSIKLQLDLEKPCVTMRFYYEDIAKEAHIDEGEIRCVFYDDKNIKQFEHYHMLDAYGAINAYEMLKNRSAYDQVVKGDGWKIIYDNSKYDEKFKDKIKSFIFDKGVRLYLEDIDLAQYSFLSDVYIYRDSKLAFKYNEEDMFEYTHSEYHYPFLNRKYPNTVAQYYASHMNFNVEEQGQGDDQLNMFDKSNLFILNYNENKRLLDAIGRVAIPVYDVETDLYVRAFEDYLSTYQEYNEDLSCTVSGYNADRYANDDARLFQFVHFMAPYQKPEEEPPQASAFVGGREVPDEFWYRKTAEEFCTDVYVNLSGYWYETKKNENQMQDSAVKYVYVTPTSENCDISELLDIQVNYRREADQTLTLFFNYANYVNTPFIKYVDGNFKIDTIDRTYLMLKSGESGELDIVVQARYYVGDTLYGYRNIKMLTFKIHNLSDDKPKFYITKTYELQPDTLDIERTTSKVKLGILPKTLDLEKYRPDELAAPISCDITFTVNSDWRIQSNSTVEVAYPAYMITPIADAGYSGYVVDTSQNGVMLVTLNDPDITQFTVKFQTVRAGNMMAEYSNRRYALVYGQTKIIDYKNQRAVVTSTPGMFMIKNSNTYILADQTDRRPVAVGLIDESYAGVYVHSV